VPVKPLLRLGCVQEVPYGRPFLNHVRKKRRGSKGKSKREEGSVLILGRQVNKAWNRTLHGGGEYSGDPNHREKKKRKRKRKRKASHTHFQSSEERKSSVKHKSSAPGRKKGGGKRRNSFRGEDPEDRNMGKNHAPQSTHKERKKTWPFITDSKKGKDGVNNRRMAERKKKEKKARPLPPLHKGAHYFPS